jgi:hypothetical protein
MVLRGTSTKLLFDSFINFINSEGIYAEKRFG